MAYTDLTTEFDYKDLLTWQNMDALAENDAYLKAAIEGLQFAGRRPRLSWNSETTVDVEENTGTSNQTRILFPDLSARSVTENLATTQKYRRFTITNTAEFTSGTEASGLRSGLAEANNTWYAIYAVKSQIDSSKFVLVGDTTTPVLANYSTLNSRYGTSSWVYLGMIKNGDNAASTSKILAFKQVGNKFNLVGNNSNSTNHPGLGSAVGVTSYTTIYTASDGTGATDIPFHLGIVLFGISNASLNVNTAIRTLDSTGNVLTMQNVMGGIANIQGFCAIESEVNSIVQGAAATSSNLTVVLCGWYDSVLAGHANTI